MNSLPAVVPKVTFKYRINFGTVMINPNGDKPYTADKWVEVEETLYFFADGSFATTNTPNKTASK